MPHGEYNSRLFPTKPGVYFFKDSTGEIIYIGKATSLRQRLNSYFAESKVIDWKTTALLDEYADIDYVVTSTEMEASLLEAQLIAAHQPKYNVLLKDGQPFVYILFTEESLPRMKIVRNIMQKGVYIGPFLKKQAVRKLFSFLLHTFKLNICNKKLINGCLDYHIGTCPGVCRGDFNSGDYLFRLQLVQDLLSHRNDSFENHIKEKIKEYNKVYAFEKAQKIHHYLGESKQIFAAIAATLSLKKRSVDDLLSQIGHPLYKEHLYTDGAMHELQAIVGVSVPINTVDCFDISHFQSSYLVGSAVRFTNGQPDKNEFRRFSIKTLAQQNDYAALQEIVRRRYAHASFPDLICIDGGKGQRNAIIDLVAPTPCISLAKREETIYSDRYPEGIIIRANTKAGKLLIALRDYTHHFAITYHRLKRKKGFLA